jgi:hypothetical protein
MTTTTMPSGELFLRWLRTLPPVHADLMCGLAATHMPEFTAEWVKAARRLIVEENDEKIEHLCNILFAGIGDTPKCIYCFSEFSSTQEASVHRKECDDRRHALLHPNELPYMWPEDMEV